MGAGNVTQWFSVLRRAPAMEERCRDGAGDRRAHILYPYQPARPPPISPPSAWRQMGVVATAKSGTAGVPAPPSRRSLRIRGPYARGSLRRLRRSLPAPLCHRCSYDMHLNLQDSSLSFQGRLILRKEWNHNCESCYRPPLCAPPGRRRSESLSRVDRQSQTLWRVARRRAPAPLVGCTLVARLVALDGRANHGDAGDCAAHSFVARRRADEGVRARLFECERVGSSLPACTYDFDRLGQFPSG